MALIRDFDKQYALLSLLGLQNNDKKGEKLKLTIQAEKNPIGNLKNNINYN